MDWNKILIVLLILSASPFIIFLCVKLGTYAYFSGRQAYKQQHKDENNEQ